MIDCISRKGFYTVEAAIFLPLVILTILSIAYYIRIDGAWETSMDHAIDKCNQAAAFGQSGIHSEELNETVDLNLPAGFSRGTKIRGRILYRDFIGKKYSAIGLGTDGLEEETDSVNVWIFPKSGKKFHKEDCTYVKATVHGCILTSSIKRRYETCSICHSETIASGSIVFCFNGEDTSYHCGSCRSIVRHTSVIDKEEALAKGYTPCSKCGGS